jgi:hypothetical protein
MKKTLDENSLEQLRATLKSQEWGALKQDALNAWNNKCSNKIVSSENVSVEAMSAMASELKYGTLGIVWFFSVFLPELTRVEKDKVDKSKE